MGRVANSIPLSQLLHAVTSANARRNELRRELAELDKAFEGVTDNAPFGHTPGGQVREIAPIHEAAPRKNMAPVAKGTAKKRTMSAAARKRISLSAKKRWAAYNANKKAAAMGKTRSATA